MNRSLILFLTLLMTSSVLAQARNASSEFVLARLKYSGGGDWYNDPSTIPNLLDFMAKNTNVDVGEDERIVEILDEALFSYPMIFMTGHGRVAFSKMETQRLRRYLTSGGFLYADDDYGMDESFRQEIRKVLPDAELVEIPFSHDIFRSHYNFPNGAPKIHEHDGGPPKSYGIFVDGRMVVFYTFNTNISDGWADENVHDDPPEVRQRALEMGTNIVVYTLMN